MPNVSVCSALSGVRSGVNRGIAYQRYDLPITVSPCLSSVVASGGTRNRPKVFREVPVLPITFIGGGRVGRVCGRGGGRYSVGGSVTA